MARDFPGGVNIIVIIEFQSQGDDSVVCLVVSGLLWWILEADRVIRQGVGRGWEKRNAKS